MYKWGEPVTGWRQYPPNLQRDLEARRAKLQERTDLIRQQCAAIKANCEKNHKGSSEDSCGA